MSEHSFPDTRMSVLGNDARFAELYDRALVAFVTRVFGARGVTPEDAREIVQRWWESHLQRRTSGRSTVRETFEPTKGRFRAYLAADVSHCALDWLRSRGTLRERGLSSSGGLDLDLRGGNEAEFHEFDSVRDHALRVVIELRHHVEALLPSELHRRYFSIKWPGDGSSCPADSELEAPLGLTRHQLARLKGEVLDVVFRAVDYRLRAGRPVVGDEAERVREELRSFHQTLADADPDARMGESCPERTA